MRKSFSTNIQRPQTRIGLTNKKEHIHSLELKEMITKIDKNLDHIPKFNHKFLLDCYNSSSKKDLSKPIPQPTLKNTGNYAQKKEMAEYLNKLLTYEKSTLLNLKKKVKELNLYGDKWDYTVSEEEDKTPRFTQTFNESNSSKNLMNRDLIHSEYSKHRPSLINRKFTITPNTKHHVLINPFSKKQSTISEKNIRETSQSKTTKGLRYAYTKEATIFSETPGRKTGKKKKKGGKKKERIKKEESIKEEKLITLPSKDDSFPSLPSYDLTNNLSTIRQDTNTFQLDPQTQIHAQFIQTQAQAQTRSVRKSSHYHKHSQSSSNTKPSFIPQHNPTTPLTHKHPSSKTNTNTNTKSPHTKTSNAQHPQFSQFNQYPQEPDINQNINNTTTPPLLDLSQTHTKTPRSFYFNQKFDTSANKSGLKYNASPDYLRNNRQFSSMDTCKLLDRNYYVINMRNLLHIQNHIKRQKLFSPKMNQARSIKAKQYPTHDNLCNQLKNVYPNVTAIDKDVVGAFDPLSSKKQKIVNLLKTDQYREKHKNSKILVERVIIPKGDYNFYKNPDQVRKNKLLSAAPFNKDVNELKALNAKHAQKKINSPQNNSTKNKKYLLNLLIFCRRDLHCNYLNCVINCCQEALDSTNAQK